MIEYTKQEGVLSFWCFWLDQELYARIRKHMCTEPFLQKAFEKSQSCSDKEALDHVLFLVASTYSLVLLSKQNYSSYKLVLKLKQLGIPKEAAQKAVVAVQEKGYIDDEALCTRRIEVLKRSGKSSKEIASRLKQDGFVASVPLGSDEEALFLCLHKKYPQWKEMLRDHRLKTKLISGLIRRGFSTDVVFAALQKNHETWQE